MFFFTILDKCLNVLQGRLSLCALSSPLLHMFLRPMLANHHIAYSIYMSFPKATREHNLKLAVDPTSHYSKYSLCLEI